MKYRNLGSLTVSEIGFGAWGIGGLTEGATSYGPTNDKISRSAIKSALRHGINFFDTSNIYGDGLSEELIGEEAKEWGRDRVVIATKGGLSKHKGIFDISPHNLRKSLEASLRRLQTNHVDLYQLHMDDHHSLDTVQFWEVLETLQQLKAEGLTKEIGISLKSPKDGVVAISLGFKILQINFSMIDQRAWDSGLLAMAASENVKLIARTPFCFGFLTGRLKNLDFDPTDHRSTWPRNQLEKWLEASKLFNYVNTGDLLSRRLYELALKFCLFPKAVSTVIAGIMTPMEAAENAIASGWPDLTVEEITQIRKIYKENKFYITDGLEKDA